MIPESFIQELLNRIDIVDLIDSYVRLKKSGANFTACCPFHNEKTPSFSVSPSKQFYHCFGCGAHGTAIGFLMEYSGLSFVDAVKDLAARAGMQVPEDDTRDNARPPRGGQPKASLSELLTRAARYYYGQLKHSDKAVDYLKRRGLSGEIARKFGIGYAPDGWQNLAAVFEDYALAELQTAGLVIKNDQGRLYDRFRDRVMFPIISQRGEVIAFGGRVIGEGEPKYLNSPETPLFEKGQEVFGLPQARAALREKNTVIVVEGYMDVVALAQHGIGNVVATLGTATTARHVRKLLRQIDHIVFCFDGDVAGRKAAWRALENALEALPEQKSVGFVFLPEPEDPDSFVRNQGVEAFDRLIAEALPLSEFLMRELAVHCDMTSAEGRAKLVADAKPLLNRLQTPFLRLQLIKKLAEASGFSQAEVERLCGLTPVARPAPVRAPRQAPSLLRQLLRMLMQKPGLAASVPLAALPPNSGEAQAVRRLCEAIIEAGNPPPACSALLEHFRGFEDEEVLSQAAAESMLQPFDEEALDEEFAGATDRLLAAANRRAFGVLQAKAAKLGVMGLSAEEKQHYLQALRQGSYQSNDV